MCLYIITTGDAMRSKNTRLIYAIFLIFTTVAIVTASGYCYGQTTGANVNGPEANNTSAAGAGQASINAGLSPAFGAAIPGSGHHCTCCPCCDCNKCGYCHGTAHMNIHCKEKCKCCSECNCQKPASVFSGTTNQKES